MKTALIVAALCGIASSATAATVDLVNNGFGSIGNAVFVRADNRSAGTGVIQSFVRLQNTPNEQGYNTSGRPVQFDENTSPQFTRNLTFGQVPTVIGNGQFGLANGVAYKEFLCDINQTNANPLLSLNRVRIHLDSQGSLTNLNNFTSTSTIYDMGTTNDVQLNYTLNTGSGQGDFAMYIPVSAFGAATNSTFVYLYSQFGLTQGFECNDGFEEWSVQSAQSLVVPLPASFWAGGAMLAGLVGLRLRRR